MVKPSVAELARRLLASKGSFSSGQLARAAGISRQAVNKHIRAMLGAGSISSEGGGRSIRYVLPEKTFHKRMLRAGLAEDSVWDEVRSVLPDLNEPRVAKARGVLAHAFTEMLNNAIDHSQSVEVDVAFELSSGTAKFTIVDEGIGVYENVRRHFKLDTALAGLQEVSKGKVTTQQDRHTGEGIFFTSKAADVFQLEANGLRWSVDNRREDMAVLDVPEQRGTTVHFELSLDTTKTMDEIIAPYSQESFEFDTSRIIVKLFERGVDFVSRSEAKRLVLGLDRFRHVVVDFRGIGSIGQGFADEIFRVWAQAHPDVRLEAINMGEPVRLMVERSGWRSAATGTIVIGDRIRKMDFPIGWNESTVRAVLDDAETSTRINIPSDPDRNMVVAIRRNTRTDDWSYLGIVVAAGDAPRIGVASAFILLRQHVPEGGWREPVTALKRFVDIYGRAFTVGRSPPKKFFLDEAYPLPDLDPGTPPFLIPHEPGQPFSAVVRSRTSGLGVVSIAIGYVIDYEKYTRDLSGAGLRIAFS